MAGREALDHKGDVAAPSRTLPVVVFLIMTLAWLLAWSLFNTQQGKLEVELLEQRLQGISVALNDQLQVRGAALERLAVRQAAALEESERQRMFALDAPRYLRDFPSFSALYWVDPDGVIVQREALAQTELPEVGELPVMGAQLEPSLRRARSGNSAVLSPTVELSIGEATRVMVAAGQQGDALRGYVLAVNDRDRLLPSSVDFLAAGSPVVVRRKDDVLFASRERGVGPGRSLRIESYGETLTVELWPRRSTPWIDLLDDALLLAGLLAAGLMAVALRLSAVSRHRERLAWSTQANLQETALQVDSARAALNVAERKIGAVFESISDAVLTLDQRWRFTAVNSRAEQLTRRKAADLIGQTLWEVFPEALGTDMEREYRAAMDERLATTFEVHFAPLGGWFSVRVYPAGLGLAVYFQDISDRKGQEQAMARAQAASDRAQRLAQLGSCEHDLATGHVLMSDEALRIFGLTAAQAARGLPALLARVQFEDRARLQEGYRRLHAGEGDLDIQYRVQAADGEVRVVRELGTLARNPQGAPVTAALAMQDVTQRQRAEQAQRELTRRLEQSLSMKRLIMDNSMDVICVLDANGRFVQVSEASRRVWGRAPNEMVGHPLVDFTHPDDREEILRTLAAIMDGKPVHAFRGRLVRSDGGVVTMQLSAAWAPAERLLFAVARDITQADEQARALLDTRDNLERAQKVARMGSWELTLDHGQLDWSAQVYDIFQVKPGEFGGTFEAFAARVHPDDLLSLNQAQALVLDGHGDLDVQHRIVLPDGSVGHVHERARRICDAQGVPRLLAGTVQDVTEEVMARQQTQKERSFLLAMLENLSDGIVACDADGQLTLFNRATRELHGLPLEPVPPDRLAEHYGLFQADGITPLDMEQVPLMRALRGEAVRDVELVVVPAGQPPRVVMCSGQPIVSASGRLLGAVVAMREITDWRRQQARLRDSEQRMRATVDSALDCIVSMAADGTLTEFNPAAERTFGYRREAVIGRLLADVLIPPAQRSAHADGLARHLRGGPSNVMGRRLEMTAMHADGSDILVELTISRMGTDEMPMFTGFLRDITAYRRARDLEDGQREVLAGIAARRPLPESLEALTRLYERQYPGSLCSVLMMDEAGERLLAAAAPSLPRAYVLAIHGQPIGPKAGSCGTAAFRRQRVVSADIQADPLWADYAAVALEHGLHACWSTPVLASDGRVLATFANYFREVRAPGEGEMAVVDGLASLAAVAIEHANAFRTIDLSEQRFRSLFDEHPDAVYAMDLEGCFTAYNGRFREFNGRTEQALMGRPFDEAVAPEQVDVARVHFQAAARGEARTYELTALARDGRRLESRITNLPMVVDGRVTGVFGIAQDITLLRKHQRDLATALDSAEANSLQLRRLSESAVTLNRSIGAQDMYQQLVDKLRETLGAHQALVSLNVYQSLAQEIHAVSLSDKYARWARYDTPSDGSGIHTLVCETNQPLRLTQAELEAHPRWRGFGSQAAQHPPMRGWLAVPLIASGGRNIGVLQLSDKLQGEFTADDELVAVQFAQMASIAIERADLIEKLSVRNRFFDLSLEMFVIFDPKSRRWLQVNPVFCQLLGYSEEELCSREIMAFMHPDDRAATADRAANLARGEPVPRMFENRYLCRDGTLRCLEWMSERGEDGLVYGVGRDITQRRLAEQALRQTLVDLDNRNRELQDFAFVASHDLQEPLRKIRAFSDRLQQHFSAELSPEARDYLARSSQAAERMQTLINDLLAYSRIAARGKAFEKVDMSALLATVVDDLEARIESSGGRIEAGPLPKIEGDPTQLRQMLQNLLANALKFRAADRPPVVRVSAEPTRLGDAPAWLFRFEDNGIGFEPRHAEKVFVPFQRLHGRKDYEGTGIGLAIVRRIVERHRGTVTAEGVAGEGAVFTVCLPERPSSPSEGGASGISSS